MWRRIVISSIIFLLILTLGAGIGHFGLGWWQPSHETIHESVSGYDSASQPTTLQDVLVTAHLALDEIEQKVQDFSAVIVKRERIGNNLVSTVMFAKIREKPFSVYLNFLDRSDNKGVKGREVIYVEGRNNNNLMGHTPGLQDATLGTMSLDPKGFLAMHDERYPITEIGLANLCRQLIQRGQAAGDPSQVKVKRFPHARINTRTCSLLEIVYPVHEPKILGYLARVFLDDQWRFPIRVEVYELPKGAAKEPQLVEEYTYLDVKLNNGYTDADFDTKDRQYKFP